LDVGGLRSDVGARSSLLVAARMREMSWRELLAAAWVLATLAMYLRQLAEAMVQ